MLKVYTGAHEVITTIMLNYIASLFAAWTVYAGGTPGADPGPLWDRTAGPISETADVLLSARIPWIFGDPYRVHWGVVHRGGGRPPHVVDDLQDDAGLRIRTVGQNSKAAKYAGINVNWIIILTMMIAGGLAGLAGGIETLGLNHKFAPEFTGAVGFDGITVALLGQTDPFGVVLSAFLLGRWMPAPPGCSSTRASRRHHPGHPGAGAGLRGGPVIIRQIYRIRKPAGEVDARSSARLGKVRSHETETQTPPHRIVLSGFAIVFVVMAILVNTDTPLGENQFWLRVFFGVSALNFTLRASVPLILGALCGILCERTGIVNIGIEGMMLAGAFAAFVAKVAPMAGR